MRLGRPSLVAGNCSNLGRTSSFPAAALRTFSYHRRRISSDVIVPRLFLRFGQVRRELSNKLRNVS